MGRFRNLTSWSMVVSVALAALTAGVVAAVAVPAVVPGIVATAGCCRETELTRSA